MQMAAGSRMGRGYSHRWTELPELERRVRKAMLWAVAVVILMFPSNFARRDISEMSDVVVFTAWIFSVVKILQAYRHYTYGLCPGCGEHFHYSTSWLGRLNNPFAGRCLHCGLQKWADNASDSRTRA